MNFQFQKVRTHLLIVQAIFLLLKIECAPKLDKIQQSYTAPKKVFDISPRTIAPQKQMQRMKFDEDYTIKIDTSNVDPSYAALCVITKNDNLNDVSEFLDYHFKIGIGRIYLYDTGTDNQKQSKIFESFMNFLADGRLYYSYWNQGPARGGFNMQIYIYNICAQSFAKNHVWLGYIDTDEFIVLRNVGENEEKSKPIKDKQVYHQNQSYISNNHGDIYSDEIQNQTQREENVGSRVQNIQDFLKQYEDYGGLTMNWVLFGSSGHEKHQENALKSYTKCVLQDHVKTLINVRYWKKHITNVHFINQEQFLQDKFAVDENLEVQKTLINRRFPASKIVLFHYVTKSSEDFEVKMQRGDATGHQARQMIFYEFVNNNANYTCTEGLHLYNQLLFKNTTQGK